MSEFNDSGEEDLEEIKNIEAEIEEMATDPLNEADGEAWEDELDENISNPKVVPRPWDELRKKIKDDLKKNSRKLSLSQINQMMILANFTTLRLKGITQINASVEINKLQAYWLSDEQWNLAETLSAILEVIIFSA